jgi:hypothetical protein
VTAAVLVVLADLVLGQQVVVALLVIQAMVDLALVVPAQVVVEQDHPHITHQLGEQAEVVVWEFLAKVLLVLQTQDTILGQQDILVPVVTVVRAALMVHGVNYLGLMVLLEAGTMVAVAEVQDQAQVKTIQTRVNSVVDPVLFVLFGLAVVHLERFLQQIQPTYNFVSRFSKLNCLDKFR